MRYNRYLYQLPVQAVPITDIVKNSISSADIVTDLIIGTSLHNIQLHCCLYDTVRVQTVSHILQIGSPGFNYAHQQLKFTINN